ncbi:MAG: hypothetical protein ACJ79S_18005 [Gemmatimonadaceae bacterium]
MLFLPFAGELARSLRQPALGPTLRSVCIAVAAPDGQGAALRRALGGFVAAARSRALPLDDVLLALEHVLRECDGAVSPHDRPGLAAFVLRRAVVLYESPIVPPDGVPPS